MDSHRPGVAAPARGSKSRSNVTTSEQVAFFRTRNGLRHPGLPGVAAPARGSKSRSNVATSERVAFFRTHNGLPSPRASWGCCPGARLYEPQQRGNLRTGRIFQDAQWTPVSPGFLVLLPRRAAL